MLMLTKEKKTRYITLGGKNESSKDAINHTKKN